MTVPAMSSNGQGKGQGPEVDGITGHGGSRGPGAALTSGRVFVATSIVVILVLAGVLALAFRAWKSQYQARVAHGDAMVVKAIEPLAELTPPNLSASDWSKAVAQTRAMLETVVRSNLLDIPQLDAFGAGIAEKVAAARARPETAPAELGAIWDDVENGPGFVREVVSRRKHVRPTCLPPRKALDRVTGKLPER
jgi:hypothetical protein